MLTDPKELEIISRAKQPNIRNNVRSPEAFTHIFLDFFDGLALDGEYLDMGPGHFDFGEVIRQFGGTCLGIDNDPAIVELGRYRGYDVIETNIKSLVKRPLNRTFDGIFNKFALNAFWNWDNEPRQRALVEAISEMMRVDAWAWIAPWNGVPDRLRLRNDQIENTLSSQRDHFESYGFSAHRLTADQANQYGISGKIANYVVFTKNLRWRPAV